MRILAIFAHPDDESIGPSGTLTMLSAQGNTVGLVTLTRGEAGSLGISRSLGSDELARRRSKELQCAVEILGIKQLRLHSLPDKRLSTIPEKDGITIIQDEIESFNPDSIITFHENGITGHPDHKTTTKWIRQVLKNLEKPPRLLYFGLSEEQAGFFPQRKLLWINNQDVTHKIDVHAFLNSKLKALKCHETQAELMEKLNTTPEKFVQMYRYEYFSSIIPKMKNSGIKEKFE